MFNIEPTSRLGVSWWVCRLTGKFQRRKLSPAFGGAFFVRFCRILDTATNGSAQRSAGACRSMAEPLFLRRQWSARTAQAASAPPLGGELWRSISWSPACHEQLSWRFHWWRHSHSVPVRWRRGVARAAVGVEQAVRAAHPEPQQAAREAVRAATALLNHPAAKAVRLAILLLNRPAVRAKIALIPQGRELGLVPRRGACADAEPTARLEVLLWPAAEFRRPSPCD